MFWIRLWFARHIFVRYRFVRYRFTFVRDRQWFFPSKSFLVSKTSWRRFKDISWRHLEGMSRRRLKDILKTTLVEQFVVSQDVLNMPFKRRNYYDEDVFKTLSRYILKDISSRRLPYVLEIKKCLLGMNTIKK